MHYILDGYNIIYRLPQFKGDRTIRSEREKLVRYLYSEKRHLIRKNQISVVFDGQNNFADMELETSQFSAVQIFFSHQTNADDYIVEFIKRQTRLEMEKPQVITVVTDDKELQTRVCMLSASAIGVDEFFSPNRKEGKDDENPANTGQDKSSLTYRDLEEIKGELIHKNQ